MPKFCGPTSYHRKLSRFINIERLKRSLSGNLNLPDIDWPSNPIINYQYPLDISRFILSIARTLHFCIMKDTSEAGTATRVIARATSFYYFPSYNTCKTAVLIKRVNNTDPHAGNARFISGLRSL